MPLPYVLILLTIAAINAFAVMWTVEAWVKPENPRPLTVHDCTCPVGTFDGLRQRRTDLGGAHLRGCAFADRTLGGEKP